MLSRGSKLYAAARWAYQPIKAARNLTVDLAAARRRQQTIPHYLLQTGFKGLQIGSGPDRLPGWLNSDLPGTPNTDIGIDITKALPFPSKCLDAIYGSEVIEHIPRTSVLPFLREARRILKPGGYFRFTTPDIEAICQIALGINEKCNLSDIARRWLDDPVLTRDIWVNGIFRNWGHQWIWDYDAIHAAMTESGFSQVERVAPQITNSGISELANLEQRYGSNPTPDSWAVSMVVEAT